MTCNFNLFDLFISNVHHNKKSYRNNKIIKLMEKNASLRYLSKTFQVSVGNEWIKWRKRKRLLNWLAANMRRDRYEISLPLLNKSITNTESSQPLITFHQFTYFIALFLLLPLASASVVVSLSVSHLICCESKTTASALFPMPQIPFVARET